MRILLWHVHGSWTTAFVQGGHEYLVPVTGDRGPYGLGRARTYPWRRPSVTTHCHARPRPAWPLMSRSSAAPTPAVLTRARSAARWR